jgi:heme/copper-type cytochrome/quinol oxidase subunit 2
MYKITNADIPKKWQVSFQDPATVSMIGIIDIHHTIMFWLVYIFIVVFFLIAIEINSSISKNSFFSISSQNIRYSLKECSWLEIFWTTAPSFILFYEILPSVHSIGYGQDRFRALMTIQIIGHQWYWSYEYSTFSNLIKKDNEQLRAIYNADSTIINFSNSEIAKKNLVWFRLLDTNTKVYIPVSLAVRLLITSEDVIHSWTIPSFGIKLDAIPGRLNATVLEVQRSGLFYGQCSELCGAGHGFMPITVESLIYDGYVIIFYNLTEVMFDFVNDLINIKTKNIALD